MSRMVAVLACAALVWVSGPWSHVHVHAYPDSAKHDHDHAPAAHTHQRHVTHHDDNTHAAGPVWTAPSDPDSHAVPYSVSGVASRVDVVWAINPAATRQGLPSIEGVEHVARHDDRVHGPPGLTFASLRAPPAVPA